MNKKIGVLLVFILLLTSLVLAQIGNDTNETDSNISIDKEGIKEGLKEATSKIASKTDPIVEKEIEIPERLQTLAKILFGIEDKSSVSALVISFLVWLLFLLLFTNILMYWSLFSKEVAFAAGVILTIIMAALGIVKNISVFLINIGSYFKFLEHWSAGALGFGVVLILIIAFIIMRIGKYFREQAGITRAHEEGIEVGAELGFLQRLREMFSKVGKE